MGNSSFYGVSGKYRGNQGGGGGGGNKKLGKFKEPFFACQLLILFHILGWSKEMYK